MLLLRSITRITIVTTSLLVRACHAAAAYSELSYLDDPELGANLERHPDPNDEHHQNMVYVGRHDADGRRMSRMHDNSIKYIFGTSYDDNHRQIDEDALQHFDGPDVWHDLPKHDHRKTRAQVLKEQRHSQVSERGPKPFGHVDTHRLDGGVVPAQVVSVEPFFIDAHLVTNQEFGQFVSATYYETEAEHFGWSFVLSSFLPVGLQTNESMEVDPDVSHWVVVKGASWKHPEGLHSHYKLHRLQHPVVHVSHKDAAEYCAWRQKRLLGEREWEAAARAGHYGPNNRTLYEWGEEQDWSVASQYANLWGNGSFPNENLAEDGWRGTSPVGSYAPNRLGLYDMTGNVWEWMRGGKHKARIVRGGSYVDSLDGSFNHAATLGARATLHGTTTAGNVGFRCAKAPQRRTEYHWQWHDEGQHGQLSVEDQFGKRDYVPQKEWEDLHDDGIFEDEMDEELGVVRKKKKVVKKVEILSTEL
ncbi:hypothetical protein MPSEU_000056400 [Mayamaea pseudoterrestris]|nr:hypothetical protein MPSEU_000056400 [Mayamaea pseudoterrestris]